jgi:hypothetical protein
MRRLRPSLARAAALAVGLSLVAAAPAQARIVPQQGIGGIRLAMTAREVRSHLGAPDLARFVDDPIQGRVRVYRYGRNVARFSPGDLHDARVNTVTTTSRAERTSRGVGVGSSRRQVAHRVPRVRCAVVSGADLCLIGMLRPGRTVTTFFITDGRVSRVTVGVVID